MRCGRLLTLVAHVALAMAVSVAPLSLPRAFADEAEDRFAPVREEVLRLEKEGAYERALVLLRAVKDESLDVAGRLEKAQRLDALVTKQNEAFASDLTQATTLEREGKPQEALEALARIAKYGSPPQVQEAEAAKKRLEEQAKKAASAEKTKAAEDDKKKAVDLSKDREEAVKVVRRWLEARRGLACGTCKGARVVPCKACEGTGKKKIIYAGSAPGAYRVAYEDCPRCATQGRVPCSPDACAGTGYNRYKLEDVYWDPWPKAFRDEMERHTSKKQFVIDVALLAQGDPAATNASLPARACYAAIPQAAALVRTYERVEVSVDADGTARASYRLKLRLDERREDTVWKKVDGSFSLVPPDLAAAAKAPPPRPAAPEAPPPEPMKPEPAKPDPADPEKPAKPEGEGEGE